MTNRMAMRYSGTEMRNSEPIEVVRSNHPSGKAADNSPSPTDIGTATRVVTMARNSVFHSRSLTISATG